MFRQCPACVCWQPLDAEQCFTKLPSTGISLQIALYYYSLQIVLVLRHCTDNEDTTLSSVYRTSPASLCTAVVTYISRALSNPVVSGQMSDTVHQMALCLMHYNARLIELTQAQVLHRLDTGESHTLTQPFYSSLDFVRDNSGELVPEGTFCHLLDFLVQNEDNTQAGAPTIRMDCHPIQTNWCPQFSAIPTIFTPDALLGTTLPIYPGLGQAPNMLARLFINSRKNKTICIVVPDKVQRAGLLCGTYHT